jgi:hypothetical protein
MNRLALAGAVCVLATTAAAAQRGSSSAIRDAAASKLTEAVVCAGPLGAGAKSGRAFCDAIIASTGAGSVAMEIPRHTGTATLMFDLHPRIHVQPGAVDPAQAFARHSALVAVVGPTGTVIERAALVKEYRTTNDLFDRLVGTLPGGVKAIAPGMPESIRVTIPAGISAIGIVGVRLEVMTRALRANYDQPGMPIAIVSNARIQYK